MNRLTENDKNFGPFTLAKWSKTFSIHISSGCDDSPGTHLLMIAFGFAIRVKLPISIRPSGKYGEHSRRYGASLSDMGNGYDFVQILFGPQTHDSSTTKSWCAHLPWKQWTHVRHSIYTPSGDHFFTEVRGADFMNYFDKKEQCPKSYFRFEDYDGTVVVASCIIEEREWHKGTGWFRWLRWFAAPKIRRDLDLQFSAEVGPEKHSWKGGTVGHGIEMIGHESPQRAFRRYCEMDHVRKGRQFKLKFIGACVPPSMAERSANQRMI